LSELSSLRAKYRSLDCAAGKQATSIWRSISHPAGDSSLQSCSSCPPSSLARGTAAPAFNDLLRFSSVTHPLSQECREPTSSRCPSSLQSAAPAPVLKPLPRLQPQHHQPSSHSPRRARSLLPGHSEHLTPAVRLSHSDSASDRADDATSSMCAPSPSLSSLPCASAPQRIRNSAVQARVRELLEHSEGSTWVPKLHLDEYRPHYQPDVCLGDLRSTADASRTPQLERATSPDLRQPSPGMVTPQITCTTSSARDRDAHAVMGASDPQTPLTECLWAFFSRRNAAEASPTSSTNFCHFTGPVALTSSVRASAPGQHGVATAMCLEESGNASTADSWALPMDYDVGTRERQGMRYATHAAIAAVRSAVDSGGAASCSKASNHNLPRPCGAQDTANDNGIGRVSADASSQYVLASSQQNGKAPMSATTLRQRYPHLFSGTSATFQGRHANSASQKVHSRACTTLSCAGPLRENQARSVHCYPRMLSHGCGLAPSLSKCLASLHVQRPRLPPASPLPMSPATGSSEAQPVLEQASRGASDTSPRAVEAASLSGSLCPDAAETSPVSMPATPCVAGLSARAQRLVLHAHTHACRRPAVERRLSPAPAAASCQEQRQAARPPAHGEVDRDPCHAVSAPLPPNTSVHHPQSMSTLGTLMDCGLSSDTLCLLHDAFVATGAPCMLDSALLLHISGRQS
jgi:hypothetical protein